MIDKYLLEKLFDYDFDDFSSNASSIANLGNDADFSLLAMQDRAEEIIEKFVQLDASYKNGISIFKNEHGKLCYKFVVNSMKGSFIQTLIGTLPKNADVMLELYSYLNSINAHFCGIWDEYQEEYLYDFDKNEIAFNADWHFKYHSKNRLNVLIIDGYDFSNASILFDCLHDWYAIADISFSNINLFNCKNIKLQDIEALLTMLNNSVRDYYCKMTLESCTCEFEQFNDLNCFNGYGAYAENAYGLSQHIVIANTFCTNGKPISSKMFEHYELDSGQTSYISVKEDFDDVSINGKIFKPAKGATVCYNMNAEKVCKHELALEDVANSNEKYLMHVSANNLTFSICLTIAYNIPLKEVYEECLVDD